MYKKETPTESIVNLFSDSLKLKRSSSDLILSHSLKWSRRTPLTESIVNLFSDSLKTKKWPSDLVFITLVKMLLIYPFFEPTRLPSKKVPKWSLLLHFFRLPKYEKTSSLPSLGSLNLHRRMLPLCVLLITFAYLCLWPNVDSILLSTEPSEACLIRKPYSTLPLRLDTFVPWRIFPDYPFLAYVPFPRASLCSVYLELVCLRHSIPPL
jgi:hypothetical protein